MADQPLDNSLHHGIHVSAPPLQYDYWKQQQQQQQQHHHLPPPPPQQHRVTNVIDYAHQPPPQAQPPPPLHQPPPNVSLYHAPPMVGPLPIHLPPNQHRPMMTSLPPPPPFAMPPTNPPIQPTSVPNPQFFSTVPPPPRPPTAVPPLTPTPPTIPTLPKEPTRPDVPYYELPAGLMVPLVKLEDFEYQPLDPELIRLPPPAPLSERLVKAVEAFYTPPSHERPRNEDGWEQLSLYEFFRLKSQAKKKEEIDNN